MYKRQDPDGYAPQDYLPENLAGREYYHPTDRGYEKTIQALMEYWRELRAHREQNPKP